MNGNRPLLGALVAVGGISAIAVLLFALRPIIGDEYVPFVVFLLSVIGAAATGGAPAGLFATAVSGAVAIFLFEAPAFSFRMGSIGQVVDLALFLLAGSILSAHIGYIGRQRLKEKDVRIRLEDEAKSRAKFLAFIAHELRTPMASILSWVEILKKERERNFERTLEILERNARLQQILIQDMFDYALLFEGKMRFDMRPCDVGDLMKLAVSSMDPKAREKGVSLSYSESGSCTMDADPQRLYQVMLNLLVNAIKFTPSGGRVGICVVRTQENVEFSVTDSGKGIDPSVLRKVFEPMWQEEKTNGKGFGLGLAIAQEIVRRHGGIVVAESKGRNHGATFKVTLPCVQSGE